MPFRQFAVLLAVIVLAGAGSAAWAQDAAPAAAPPAAQQAPMTWSGLAFSSLAEFEQLIPIGMTQSDLVRTLGSPIAIMPGRGADQAYHYEYTTAENSRLYAVVIVRDGAVFIRRLYIATATGTSRVD